jgi:hypothetical protein
LPLVELYQAQPLHGVTNTTGKAYGAFALHAGAKLESSRSIILLRTRLVSWPCGLALASSTRSRLALPRSPRIWNRSIVGRENPVKRKTQRLGTLQRKCPICSGVVSLIFTGSVQMLTASFNLVWHRFPRQALASASGSTETGGESALLVPLGGYFGANRVWN